MARASRTRGFRPSPGGAPASRPASERAKALRGARYALWKNPENLTEKQQTPRRQSLSAVNRLTCTDVTRPR